MTDQEFREKLDEYLVLNQQYEILTGMHQRLYQRKERTKFPPHVSSIDEITKVRDARRELELEMRDVNGQMMQLSTQRVDLARELRVALPPNVVYHYNGYEIEACNNELSVRLEAKEMAA
jgi:hypothetical protein